MTCERIAAKIRTSHASLDILSLQAGSTACLTSSLFGEGVAVDMGLLRTSTSQGFVDKAYLTVLKRRADAEGRCFYDRHLAQGSMTRAHVVRSMLSSAEGRRSPTRIEGGRARLHLYLAVLPASSWAYRLVVSLARAGERIAAHSPPADGRSGAEAA